MSLVRQATPRLEVDHHHGHGPPGALSNGDRVSVRLSGCNLKLVQAKEQTVYKTCAMCYNPLMSGKLQQERENKDDRRHDGIRSSVVCMPEIDC